MHAERFCAVMRTSLAAPRIWEGILITLIATLTGFAVVEAAFRFATGLPVATFKDWRAERIEQRTLGARAIYDPTLGWTLKPGYRSEGYNTIALGIRRNFDEDDVRTGGILAVGDSFTDGWDDVDDDGTWPAHLEGMLSIPVVNGGVGGYGTDQIVMRAEQLLAVVRPKTLIVGFLDEDIFRSGHSSFGASKPYFTLDNGLLRYHPPAPMVPPEHRQTSWGGGLLRTVLGYSAVLDFVVGRLAPVYWSGSSGKEVFERVDNDPVGVTCALLKRLKTQADAGGVRTLLFMQYGWQTVIENEAPNENAQQVTACSRAMGFEIVDQFQPLRALAKTNRQAVTDLYAKEGDGYGHLNETGNWHAADLLARALK
jgi:hypothetical protein